jgi:hypothetical protein
MKNIKIKKHLTLMRINEKGFCDSEFINQIEFSCKHCLVNKLIGNDGFRCNEFQAKKIAKDYMRKYNNAQDIHK